MQFSSHDNFLSLNSDLQVFSISENQDAFFGAKMDFDA